MKKITPWNKEVEQLFDSIVKNGKAYTSNNTITRNLGRKYSDLFDEHTGFMDIGKVDRSKKSIIVPRIGVQVVPLPEPDSESIKLRRRKKYGIYRL